MVAPLFVIVLSQKDAPQRVRLPVVKRVLPPLVILVALVAAFILSRPKPVSSPGSKTFEVPALTLSGSVAAPSSDVPVRVAALVNGQSVADSGVVDGKYKLSLPGKLSADLGDLKGVSLLHGDGHLRGEAKASEVKILIYQDNNKNASYDLGEPKLEAALLPGGKDPNYQGFFQYKVLLLSAAASLKESQDNATGAKNFYRYDMQFQPGYNILEAELASSGYEMRAASGGNWDLLAPLLRGGKSGPATFTP